MGKKKEYICIGNCYVLFQETLDLIPTLLLGAHILRVTSLHSLKQRFFNGREHEFNNGGRLRLIVGTVDGLIVFVLPVVADGFHGEPGKHRLPLGQQQGIPQQTDTPIAIGKGMDELQFIGKHTVGIEAYGQWDWETETLLNGGDVTISGTVGKITGDSVGIYTEGDLIIEDCTVEAEALSIDGAAISVDGAIVRNGVAVILPENAKVGIISDTERYTTRRGVFVTYEPAQNEQ